jgi:hypothetical protein
MKRLSALNPAAARLKHIAGTALVDIATAPEAVAQRSRIATISQTHVCFPDAADRRALAFGLIWTNNRRRLDKARVNDGRQRLPVRLPTHKQSSSAHPAVQARLKADEQWPDSSSFAGLELEQPLSPRDHLAGAGTS